MVKIPLHSVVIVPMTTWLSVTSQDNLLTHI